MKACTVCSTPTAYPAGICDPCLDARIATERADQGLPPTVEDPEALARLGRITARALDSALNAAS